MKKITLIFTFLSLIVGGMNAQHPVAISAQEWSSKNPNPLKYGVQDFVNFHSTGQLKKGPVLHEGITDFNQVIKETRKVSKDRTLKQIAIISKFLGREVTLKEFYSNLKVMRVKMQSSFVLNAYDYESPTNESWVNHNAGVYEMICFVADGKIFPVNHVICLNATNATGLLSVVTDNATIIGGEVLRESKPQGEEDDQEAAAREALKSLKTDPNVDDTEEVDNDGSEKDPHINQDHTTKKIITPDGKTILNINVYGSDNRNVAVNKEAAGTNSGPGSSNIYKTEVISDELPPVQQTAPQVAPQQSQYRQPSCSACGGTNNQHYSNCSTLNRVATNSCNGCGNSGNYGVVRQKPDAAAITGAVFSGLNLGYNILTDVLAPNGRFKRQSAPVNIYNTYPTNPTPPNPAPGNGVDYGPITTGGTTTSGQGNDYRGVTDYVISGLNGNGGGSVSGGAGFDGGGIIP
jgi:hypothetical protein